MKHRIATLRMYLPKLEGDYRHATRDLMAGRLDVVTATRHLDAAEVALEGGDEAGATLHLLDAYEAWSRALQMQIPAKHRAKLDAWPETGGRPSRAELDVALYLAAEQETGGITARCRAALARNAALSAAFSNRSDDALRKAYKRGAVELKQE